MTYEDYERLYDNKLIAFVRSLLERIQDRGDHDLEDSTEHNNFVEYFNDNRLWRKLSREQFHNTKLSNSIDNSYIEIKSFIENGHSIENIIDVIIQENGYIGVGLISLGDHLQQYCYNHKGYERK